VDDANLKVLDIQNSSVHPDYNHVTVYHDIAVLETKPLNFNRGIQPVCLPRYEQVMKYIFLNLK
jgi:hypothetical protein